MICLVGISGRAVHASGWIDVGERITVSDETDGDRGSIMAACSRPVCRTQFNGLTTKFKAARGFEASLLWVGN